MPRDGFLLMNGSGEEEYKERLSSTLKSGQNSSPPSAVGVGLTLNGSGVNCIYHTVTKLDTLAGVAIKYGVEVADIKRLNGLVTDLQMFALKTLQIPLPGRHPPSPIFSNGDNNNLQRPSSSESSSRRNSDIFDSFHSLKLRSSSEHKVSPAMSSLQGYYGLKSDRKASAGGCEMSVYRKGEPCYLEDGPFSKPNPPLSQHRKSKSVANGLTSQNGDFVNQVWSQETDSSSWVEKLARRPQKSQADFRTPEKLLKEETNNNPPVSAITGKALALRPKSSANRTVSGGVDGEVSLQNTVPLSSGDSYSTEHINGVRKSSSTPSLQDSDNGALTSLWATSKWSLKPDFQALSAAAIAIPIFDGLPKPMGRKNKTALD